MGRWGQDTGFVQGADKLGKKKRYIRKKADKSSKDYFYKLDKEEPNLLNPNLSLSFPNKKEGKIIKKQDLLNQKKTNDKQEHAKTLFCKKMCIMNKSQTGQRKKHK